MSKTWTLPLDEMERLEDHEARLLAGTFHVHPRTEPDDTPTAFLTPEEWREMAERARLRGVAITAVRRQEAA
jgi:hypothetical protein